MTVSAHDGGDIAQAASAHSSGKEPVLYVWLVVVVVVLALLFFALAVRVVKQYEQGVLFRLGRVVGVKRPGLTMIVPFIDVLHRVSLRIITMPIQSQGIITRDNVSVDVSAVAYYRVVDAAKSVVAIESVGAAINQIAQTTLRKVVGQHTLDETLSETDRINVNIREILDVATEEWGVVVTLVELKDIQLPDSMKRAMARQAEAAAAQPAEPRGDRRGQEHHRCLPRAADEHHRGTGLLPRQGGHRREPHAVATGCGYGTDRNGTQRKTRPVDNRIAAATRTDRGRSRPWLTRLNW
jgi:SPFH domain / Band 7 family